MAKKRRWVKGAPPVARPKIDHTLSFADQLRQYQQHIDKNVRPKHQKFLQDKAAAEEKAAAETNLHMPVWRMSSYERRAICRAWGREPIGTKRMKQLTILLLLKPEETSIAAVAKFWHTTEKEIALAVALVPDLVRDQRARDQQVAKQLRSQNGGEIPKWLDDWHVKVYGHGIG